MKSPPANQNVIQKWLTPLALACGIAAVICGTIATVILDDPAWLAIGIVSLLLAVMQLWLEKK